MHDEDVRLFREMWPLLMFRYGLIALGMALWLSGNRDGAGQGGENPQHVPLIALMLAGVLLLDLPIFGPSPSRRRQWWAMLQATVGGAAALFLPTLPAVLVLAAVLNGLSVTVKLSRTIAFYAGAAGVVALGLSRDHSIVDAASYVSVFALSLWVGRIFLLRLEENREHRKVVRELESAQARIARLAETARELSAAEERERLAAELHDTLGHALVAVLLQVQVTKKLVTSRPDQAVQRLDLIENNVKKTLEQVRRALKEGRSIGQATALADRLKSVASDFQAADGPEVCLAFFPDEKALGDVPPKVADVVYRTVQEALTNAVRHGQARQVDVKVAVEGHRLRLSIQDDGVGAAQVMPGMGLTGMVSRVQSVGGSLRFDSAPGEGFHVEVGVKLR